MPSIFLVGPMGSGKTTIGRLLAAELGLEFFDSDQEIETASGANISWIFDVEGEEGFRKRERSMIELLTQKKDIVLATGGGAVLDAANRACLQERGSAVYISAPLELLLERTSQDKTRPLLSVEDPAAALKEIIKQREPLYREVAQYSISTEKKSSKQVVSQIIKLVYPERS